MFAFQGADISACHTGTASDDKATLTPVNIPESLILAYYFLIFKIMKVMFYIPEMM
jgi:hypothetical protein